MTKEMKLKLFSYLKKIDYYNLSEFIVGTWFDKIAPEICTSIILDHRRYGFLNLKFRDVFSVNEIEEFHKFDRCIFPCSKIFELDEQKGHEQLEIRIHKGVFLWLRDNIAKELNPHRN